ncbi:MAG: DUF6159 family protein [Opitutaceae bacterium]
MNFIPRVCTSLVLMQRSLQVMRRHPRLLLFPVVSLACMLVLALFFFTPVLVVFAQRGWTSLPQWAQVGERLGDFVPRDWVRLWEEHRAAIFAYGAVVYFVSLFVSTFFNVAFYTEILSALNGGPVSLRAGFRFAASRGRTILMWTLLAGSVGFILRVIEERLSVVGRLVVGLIGATWSVAAMFAIPVIVRRAEPNAVAVLRDSATTLKRTWGESVTGFIGLELGGALLMMLLALVGIPLAAVAAQARWPLVGLSLGALTVLAMIGVGFVAGMATHIYRCALYVYASEGVVPGDYTAEMMDAGWKVKEELNAGG